MGADLLLTWALMPTMPDGSPVNFDVYIAKEQRFQRTPEGERALAQMHANVDALTEEKVVDIFGDMEAEWLLEPGDLDKIAAGTVTEDAALLALAKEKLHILINLYLGGSEGLGRDVEYVVVGPQPALMTGGMSWGDSPTESWDDISMLGASGVGNFVLEENSGI